MTIPKYLAVINRLDLLLLSELERNQIRKAKTIECKTTIVWYFHWEISVNA